MESTRVTNNTNNCKMSSHYGRLRLLSLNTRGIVNKLKRKSMFSFIKQQKIDIACLQETHVSEKIASQWEREWGGKLHYNQGSAHSKGEVLLISKDFKGEVNVQKCIDRIMICTVKTQSMIFTLANVYAPNQSSEKMFFLQKHHHFVKRQC